MERRQQDFRTLILPVQSTADTAQPWQSRLETRSCNLCHGSSVFRALLVGSEPSNRSRIRRNDVRLLPLEWRENLPEHDPQRSRYIGDFLAGMTDRYATDRHREIGGEMA